MANLIIFTVCLAAVCSLPGGDSANLSLQRHPLDVGPRSADNPARVARSVLAARVIDEHGNPVNLRSTGQPGSRTVVNHFVTSHGRQQRTLTSGGQRRNYNIPTIQRRVLSAVPKPRQTLSGSRGFALHNGQRFDIKPHQGAVPYNRWQVRDNQHHRNNAAANHRSRKSVSTIQRRRVALFSNQRVPGRYTFTSEQRRSKFPCGPVCTSVRSSAGQHLRLSVTTPSAKRHFNTNRQNSRTRTVKPQSSQRNGNFQHSVRNNNNLRPSSNVLGSRPASVPSTEVGTSVYEHGLDAHMPRNAQGMPTFLIRPRQPERPRFYLDRTKGTSTLHTSQPGQCPVVDQFRCGPLPEGPKPPSCSNDYQCHGQMSRCCYNPCLASSKCVQPVNG